MYMNCNYRCCAKFTKMRTSSILLKSLEHRSSEVDLDLLDKNVFLTMRNDHITAAAKKDNIIRKVGEYYYLKHSRNHLRNRNFSAKHMRIAASLLLKVREFDNSNYDLEQYLKPEKFPIVQKAALSLAGSIDGTYTKLLHPSTAKNLGYELKKWVEIKEEIAIIENDKAKMVECKYFLKLYQRRWGLISSSACKQLEEKQYNNKVNIPSTSEVKILTDHIKTKLENLEYNEETDFKTVVKYTQTRLILFNKRRPGELEGLKVEDYKKRKNNDNILSDVVATSLTELEKKLLETHDIVTVRGKRGHAVPIIIPPDCFDALEFLCDEEMRRQNSIKNSNPYMFANCGDEVHRAVASLRSVVCSCDSIFNVKNIKATSLRKYMATNCQLLNLNDSELEWVVRHMGHSKLTHMQSYRLSSSTIERTKIAKLLLLMENGDLLKKAQGVNLSDKELDDMILNYTNNDADDDLDNDSESDYDMDYDDMVNVKSGEHNVQDNQLPCSDGEKSCETGKESDDMDSSDEDSYRVITMSKKRKMALEYEVPQKKVCSSADKSRTNRKWLSSDVDLLWKEFSVLFNKKIYPSYVQIRALRKKYSVFNKRTDAQIKAKCVHLMSKSIL